MNNSSQAMGLGKVRDWHREVASENASRRSLCAPNGARWDLWNDEFNKHVAMADAIDAHLTPRDVSVSDEDVERALNVRVGAFKVKTAISSEAVRAILQADRQRVGGISTARSDVLKAIGGYLERYYPNSKISYDHMAYKVTERLLTQRVRPGWKLVPDKDMRECRFGDHYDDGYSNGYADGWNECRDAMLATDAPIATTGWLPIESAPRDGSYVLLTMQWDDEPVVATWLHDSWIACSGHLRVDGDACISCLLKDGEVNGWLPIPRALWRQRQEEPDAPTHDDAEGV